VRYWLMVLLAAGCLLTASEARSERGCVAGVLPIAMEGHFHAGRDTALAPGTVIEAPLLAGEDVRMQLLSGCRVCMEQGQTYPALPSQPKILVWFALAGWWAGDADGRTGISFAQYHGNGNRLLSLPMVGPQGKVYGFGRFFLRAIQRHPSSSLPPAALEYVDDIVPGRALAEGATPATSQTWGRLKLLYRN
jgi:hypothetical protein